MDQIQTVGIPKYFSIYKLNNNFILNLLLYDTTSRENCKPYIETYYKKVDAIILVYDITNKESFEECQNYFKSSLEEKSNIDTKVLLLGNKKDCEEQRQVTYKEAKEFADLNKYIFMEISCLEINSIYEAFKKIITEAALIKMKDENKNNSRIRKRNEQNSVCKNF